MEISRKPVIASHSNARAIHNHPRNLRDEQLQAVSQTGGVIGINFYTAFIGPSGKSDMAALIRHIEHIIAIAGEDAIGLGADFDGCGSLPEPIAGVQSLDSLFEALARLNYPDQVIEKLAGRNFLRVFRNVLGTNRV
jgi:membrane dipeptidase